MPRPMLAQEDRRIAVDGDDLVGLRCRRRSSRKPAIRSWNGWNITRRRRATSSGSGRDCRECRSLQNGSACWTAPERPVQVDQQARIGAEEDRRIQESATDPASLRPHRCPRRCGAAGRLDSGPAVRTPLGCGWTQARRSARCPSARLVRRPRRLRPVAPSSEPTINRAPGRRRRRGLVLPARRSISAASRATKLSTNAGANQPVTSVGLQRGQCVRQRGLGQATQTSVQAPPGSSGSGRR